MIGGLHISITAADRVFAFRNREVTHLVGISNPASEARIPEWFKGTHLGLKFGDVVSELDARRCGTRLADSNQIQQAVEFARAASSEKDSPMLVYCDYGASRSPALAYVMLAAVSSHGLEEDCSRRILIREETQFPTKIGDEVLKRNRALLKPVYRHHRSLSQ